MISLSNKNEEWQFKNMNKSSRIFYFSYPQSNIDAPHQAMAAIQLLREGFTLDYFCWGHGEPLLGLATDRYHEIKKDGICSAYKLFILLLKELFFSKKYNVVYVQGAQQTPFLFWLPFLKKRYRIVYHTQDFLEPCRHRFYEFFERWFTRRAYRVICNESNRARFMKSYYNLETMPDVIQTALPKEWPLPSWDDTLRAELLAFAEIDFQEGRLVAVGGGYSSVRCTEQLIEAMTLLPKNYRFIFTGLSSEGHEALQRHKVINLAIILERLSFQKLLRHYAVCDAGLLLYANDGIGNYYQAPGRLTEYMSVGLPFVASNFPNFELLSLKYNLGKVCNTEDPEDIARTIQEVCDVTVRERENNRNRLQELSRTVFSYEKNFSPLVEMLSE
ncbi:MAG: glycosyltransferase involved in cell wall biosynthesis [Desulforhopalus sp.]|jgi:glycosyltransferase involved in cell wall biosynthesis